MFGLFKKKSKDFPEFQNLKEYSNKNKYFVRTLQWDWLDDRMIHVFDNNRSRIITMDEWPQMVYLDADGQKTIEEYILSVANQYKRKIPPTLDKDMISVIEGLIEDGEIIQLMDKKTSLPYYLDEPKSSQDIDRAYKLMVKDGYIKNND